MKVLHSICLQIWKTQQLPQDWKRSVFIPIPKTGDAKECSNHCTIALISYASRVILKILQAMLQQYMNHELSDVQAVFRKGRGTRDQIASIHWLIEKAREFPKKHLLLLHQLHKNIWLCGSQQTMENSSRDGNTRPPYLSSEKPVCRTRSKSLYQTWSNGLVQKAVYRHPAYLTYMQSTSWEMLSWMTHELESN